MSHNDELNTDYGTSKKTLNKYMYGMLMCIILTIIPFYIVMNEVFAISNTFIIIYVCAILQFFVQVKYFIGLNFKTQQSKLNVLSFIFTLAILAFVIAGILWIMYNLDYNMMRF